MVKSADACPILTTRRLHLRRVLPRDKVGFHACFGDFESMRYWNFPASKTVAETEKALGWLAKTSSPCDHLAWTVADRADDQCIGMVNYHHREVQNRGLEIGYIIGRKHQGKRVWNRGCSRADPVLHRRTGDASDRSLNSSREY